MKKLLLLLLLAAQPLFGQFQIGARNFSLNSGVPGPLWAGQLSPIRGADWTTQGVTGGIPSAGWAQCGNTVQPEASAATINTAILACASLHYVLLSLELSALSTGLLMRSNMAVRGSRSQLTFFCRSSRVATLAGVRVGRFASLIPQDSIMAVPRLKSEVPTRPLGLEATLKLTLF